MSLPKVVNGTVGFGNDALPVKPFNTPLAKTTRLASVRALKPMTARIGLTFVFETLIGISFVLLEVWICGVRAHSTCASTERLRQIFLSQLDGYGQLGRIVTLGCALSRLRFATLGCALSRLRFATLGCALSRLRFALWAASLDCVWRFARRARRCFLSASRFSSVSIPNAACIWCMAVDFQCRICRIVVLKWAAISASELSSA